MVLQISTAHLIYSSQRPKPHESVSGWTSPPPRLLGRNAGCDAVLSSCGPNGGCCDEHDSCWEVEKCTALSWIPGVNGLDCWSCNWNVMKCAVMRNPGMSSCCSEGTCGMDDDQAETHREGQRRRR